VFGCGRAVNSHGYELYGGAGRLRQLIDHVWCAMIGALESSIEWADITNQKLDMIASLCDASGNYLRTPGLIDLEMRLQSEAEKKLLFTESVHLFGDILGDTSAVVLNHIFGSNDKIRLCTLDHLQGKELEAFCLQYSLSSHECVSSAAVKIDMQYRNKVLVHNRFSRLYVTPQGVSEPYLNVSAFGDRITDFDQHLMSYGPGNTSVTKLAPAVFDLVCEVTGFILANRSKGITLLRV
jgi:hypothetical protein